MDFNPRSPHGERRWHSTTKSRGLLFQSTLPARGATSLCALAVIVRLVISIHAPRTGSDRWAAYSTAGRTYFNPRSPHGERLIFLHSRNVNNHFNPRSPHGERLRRNQYLQAPPYFNPRSPHGERLMLPIPDTQSTHFNPRSPHGERPETDKSIQMGLAHFNPRSPHGERR